MNELFETVKAIVDPSLPLYSNLSNVSAVLNTIGTVNWCGFYIADGDMLFVGPFQGDTACTRIPFGKGVCGTAAQNMQTVIVDDVGKFPGHIACSSLSRSEIVVPIIKDGTVVAVIDIDSLVYERFDREIADELEKTAQFLSKLF